MVRSDLLAKFASDGVKKQWRIVADDGTVITNDVIVDGSVQLQEPLNTSEQLEFGSCESACFSFQIYERTRLKNKILTVYVTLDNMPEMQVGVYKVDSDKLTANRKMRDIVAYDKLHEILDADVKEWYNTILPNLDAAVSLKQFRESFLRHFNLTFDEENLIGDTLTIHKTLDASETAELKGSAILPGICQLNAAFGHIRRDGSFAFVTLPPHQTEASFGLQNGAPYMEDPTYEEYDVQVIDKVVIRESDSGTETATTYTSDYTTAIPDSDNKKYSALTVYNSKAAEYIAIKEAKEAELEQVNTQLRYYEEGGNVVLTNREKVSASAMSAAGWTDFDNASADDYATVYTSTYSNDNGTLAGNFTPIETDRSTGKLRTILTPDQLRSYAYSVLNNEFEDWRNLKIGYIFTASNNNPNAATNQAVHTAESIHALSEQQMEIRDAIDEARSAYLKDCTNAFIIEDNFLIYDATAEQRDAIAEQIYNKIHGIYYRPFELKAPGNLCYEVGDSIKIETKYDVIDTYILERSFSGTGHCEDTYNARGTEKRNEQVTSVSDQVEKLNGRYARLKKNIDGISSDVGKRISDQNTEIRSWVYQRFNELEFGVTEDNILEALNKAMTSVTVRANGIDFKSTGSFTANTKNFIVDAAGNVRINSLDAAAQIIGARIDGGIITSSSTSGGSSTVIREGCIISNQIYLGSTSNYSQITPNQIALGNDQNNNSILSNGNLVLVNGNSVIQKTIILSSSGDGTVNKPFINVSATGWGGSVLTPTDLTIGNSIVERGNFSTHNTVNYYHMEPYLDPDWGPGYRQIDNYLESYGSYSDQIVLSKHKNETYSPAGSGALGYSEPNNIATFYNTGFYISHCNTLKTTRYQQYGTYSYYAKTSSVLCNAYGFGAGDVTMSSLRSVPNSESNIPLVSVYEGDWINGSVTYVDEVGNREYVPHIDLYKGMTSTEDNYTYADRAHLVKDGTIIVHKKYNTEQQSSTLWYRYQEYLLSVYGKNGLRLYANVDNYSRNKNKVRMGTIESVSNEIRLEVYPNLVATINDSPILTAKNNWKYSYRLYREEAVDEYSGIYASVYISSAMNFRPQNDNTMSCGSSLSGWTDVFAYNGITQPSDERIKTDIIDPNTKYLDFIKNVKPKTYKYKKGQSGRTHLGFIAQDIETLLSKCGIETSEFAGFVKTPIMSEEEPDAIEDFSYSLRYGEFIPLLLMYIKDNERRIKELEEQLNGAV